MYVLAIINQKGGVGKTTTAVTLAHGLAIAGRDVLLVDLDAQGNVADALGLVKRDGLYSLLFRDLMHALDESGRVGLDVILSDKATSAAKQQLVAAPFRERVLLTALEKVRTWYDYCILDAAPGVDLLQVAAMVAANGFLIPVALDHLAVVGAGDALATVAALRNHGEIGARFLGVLPTFWDRVTRESADQLTNLVETFAALVWPPIPLDVKAREAPAHGETLWEYAPGCRALEGVEIGNHTAGEAPFFDRGYAGSPVRRVGGYRAVMAMVETEREG